jgi:hypothetical protein
VIRDYSETCATAPSVTEGLRWCSGASTHRCLLGHPPRGSGQSDSVYLVSGEFSAPVQAGAGIARSLNAKKPARISARCVPLRLEV